VYIVKGEIVGVGAGAGAQEARRRVRNIMIRGFM
jgi:hypothetical protein